MVHRYDKHTHRGCLSYAMKHFHIDTFQKARVCESACAYLLLDDSTIIT